MNTVPFLDELAAAGVRLSPEGDDLIAAIPAGVSLDPCRSRIRDSKPALLAALHLQAQIVAAATAASAAFDRATYDALWQQWYAIQDQEMNP